MMVAGHCEAVILDTENLRGASVPVLAALRRRGFRLQVSNITLEELWARAFRDSKPGLLTARIPRIATFIDQTEPVKTAGADIVGRVRGSAPGAIAPPAPNTEALAKVWHDLAGGHLPDAFILQAGPELARAGIKRESTWMETVAAAASLPEWNGVDASERDIAEGVAKLLAEQVGRKEGRGYRAPPRLGESRRDHLLADRDLARGGRGDLLRAP